MSLTAGRAAASRLYRAVGRTFLGVVLGLWAAALVPAGAAAQDIGAANTSRYVGNGRWDWTVFITAAPETLRGIRCVEYTLHPTFPDPVRRECEIRDPRQPFGLRTNGWGTFEIGIKVFFRNGKVQTLRHMLTLTAPPVEAPLQITARNVARELRKGWWEWTAFIVAPSQALDQIRCVVYTLHPTFPDPVREVCERGAGARPFALTARGWGTFRLQIRVIFKDGRVQQLTHDLTF